MMTAALLLGLGILDSALHLTKYSIIKELAKPADRRGSQWNDGVVKNGVVRKKSNL